MAEPLKAVEADAKADDEGVVVPLVTDDGSVDILVPRRTCGSRARWRRWSEGRSAKWVHLAVEDEKTLAAWDAAKKRYRDLSAFTDKWAELSGRTWENRPAPRLPRRRSTRKR
jgi:hypothetical protein